MDGTLTINGPKHTDGLTVERQEKPFHPIEHVDARLISLLDMAADSICLIDDHSRILLFNKASETLFGYSAEDVIGQRVDILMPQKYAEHHDGWIARYLETGEHSIIGIGREVQGQHKDGTTFPFDLSVGVAETENGKQFIGVMRDLRARKEDEQRLRSLQTELNQMTRINAMDEMGATVAHELNQPLTAIILYLQAVERKVSKLADRGPITSEDVEQLSDLCGRAIQEAQRSSSLLQRIRSIIEKKEPERTTCDLVEIIRKAHKLSLVGFSATDVFIDLSAPDDLPPVSVDPVQIEQIFLNLLRNAFQAMREVEQKAIKISLKIVTDEEDRRDRLQVRFQDTGSGIPDSHRKNLFKAFDSERRNGMGLGLAIARSIAQNHGGSLDLAPFDEAQPGACFLLTLPIASSPSDESEPKTESSESMDGSQ
ncbi:two-component system, LuxR family, sensor kinase FixL [Cohaesibacter sp. ES.047]|uniref:two-component system sensor histidine kinase NtrB n=1 Tax=Cohaesibacter sp. ES.047 TaxID=1798205 RepID=UPI000BB93929|nr:PAS domain S-box protein [Cohaesibacter sp. ES.047]SNY91929.1 two-component system, LuxR family, sensor kinase FixL [Cohaesibacter sp. ES.047]